MSEFEGVLRGWSVVGYTFGGEDEDWTGTFMTVLFESEAYARQALAKIEGELGNTFMVFQADDVYKMVDDYANTQDAYDLINPEGTVVETYVGWEDLDLS